MSRLKNGVSFKKTFNKAVAFSATLLMMTGVASTASAGWDGYCGDPCCPVDCCEMPDYTIYADFLYWQVHPEGLEFARVGGFGANQTTTVEERGVIYSPDCEFEPGFRVGAIIDLGCCNWDFYAQYTWLHSCFGRTLGEFNNAGTPTVGPITPIISNAGGFDNVAFARGNYDHKLNVLDFGMGRTFEVNCCFDFRPHFGFKATWQEINFDVLYQRQTASNSFEDAVARFKTDFDGIGLRGGFDAAWRFSPCFSLVGGMAVSTVYSDLCSYRLDNYQTRTDNVDGELFTPGNNKADNCVLIPVIELMLGLRWDSRVCDCYDVFVFVGWENQVWFDLNRNINYTFFPDPSEFLVLDYQNGPSGNITYQGLTVRAGMGF